MLAPLLLIAGVALVVAGVAMWSLPAALVVSGLLLAAGALLIDFASLTGLARARTNDGGGG